MQNKLSSIIFAGAIWGIAEGTIGWILHILHVPHVAFWLSPVIIACIIFAYKATGQASSVFFTAIVAALIKCTDLLIPINVPLYYVLNPAMYIVAEGLIGALIIIVFRLKEMSQLKFGISTRLAGIVLAVAVAVNILTFVCR